MEIINKIMGWGEPTLNESAIDIFKEKDPSVELIENIMYNVISFLHTWGLPLIVLIILIIVLLNFKKNYVPIKANCVKAESIGGGKYQVWCNFSFNKDEKESEYCAKVHIEHHKPSVGERVDIYINKNNPQKAISKKELTDMIFMLRCIGVGAIVMLFIMLFVL